MAEIDATVLGAGVFGLAVAWELARRGARVRVLDPAGPGAGASGGLVGALCPAPPEPWTEAKAFQIAALAMAGDWWAGVAAAGGGDPGYARTGRAQPLPDAAALARAEARAAAAALRWPAGTGWRILPADGLPGVPATDSGLVAVEALSARLDPRRAVAALVAALAARGAEVLAGREAERAGEAGAVVHATGWQGLAALSAAFGRELGRGEKGQAARLAARPPAGARIVSASGLWVVPHGDGTTAVGSTVERVFADARATDGRLEALVERARALVPWLGAAPVIERWAGLRPRTPGGGPLLGPWPGRPGHFVANGGGGTGFALAPLSAVLLADLLLEGRDGIPAFARP
jgi:glycine/D-amino acid oxidase-like deaminating enzyme